MEDLKMSVMTDTMAKVDAKSKCVTAAGKGKRWLAEAKKYYRNVPSDEIEETLFQVFPSTRGITRLGAIQYDATCILMERL